jgi:translation initiation factor 2 subunit 2
LFLSLVGTKKTLWVNFQEICKMMNRPHEHVFQFMMAELGTEGSIDGNQRLVIRGKFVPKVCKSSSLLPSSPSPLSPVY